MTVEHEDTYGPEPPGVEELFEIEVLDGEIVEQGTSLEPATSPGRGLTRISPPALQTAVAAATGFLAGAATLALLRRYASRLADGDAVVEGSQPRGERPRGLRGGTTYLVHVRWMPPPQ